MGTQFEHVAIKKTANVHADGKCVSYTLTFPDGAVKAVGVVLPGEVTFAADTDETVEFVEGKGRVRVGQDGAWSPITGGQRFHVTAQTRFDVEAAEPVHYVAHLGRQQAAP